MSAEPIYSAGDDSEDREINSSTLRDELAYYLKLASNGHRVYVTEGRSGRRIAALVAPEVAERDQQAEDEYWRARVAEAEASGTVTWNEAIAALEGGQA